PQGAAGPAGVLLPALHQPVRGVASDRKAQKGIGAAPTGAAPFRARSLNDFYTSAFSGAETCCQPSYFVVKCNKMTSDVDTMENTLFRSALAGCNRQDVMAYIEKAQKEASETAQRLEEENETLRREGEELRQSLEALTQERDQLSGQTVELTEQCAGLRSALEAETAAREAARKDA